MDSQSAHKIYTRERNWDYHQPAIYFLTLTVADRLPLLGQLVGGIDDAKVELTPLGKRVTDLFNDIPNHHPEIRIIRRLTMPDHFHAIIHVTRPMPVTLGICIRGFKWACNAALQQLSPSNNVISSESLSDNTTLQQRSCLFSPDFYPSRLKTRGQLQSMIDYLCDNPRRLAVKRANAAYFRIERGVVLEGISADMVGNKALLNGPLMAVHIRHAWTDNEVEQYTHQCLEAAKQGIVLISPFISIAERNVRDRILRQGGSIIVIRQDGFGELYKPEPMYFDACAQGRVLLVSIGEYRQIREHVTRAQCVTMNTLAEHLAQKHPTP